MIFKYLSRLSPLSQRIYTALFLLALFFGCLSAGSIPFLLLLSCIFILSFLEWKTIIFQSSFNSFKKNFWFIAGFFYLLMGFGGMFLLSQLDHFYMVGTLILIWTTDTGAFFIGKALKGPKLAPSISPAKTWSGAMGGLLCAFFLGLGSLYFFGKPISFYSCVLILLISATSILGDLLESYVKRRIGVKDTSSLLPGHGGVLDRIDSPLAVGFLIFCNFIFQWVWSKI